MDNQSAGLPVKLKFTTQIREGTRKETVAFEAVGLYYVKGQNTYLKFQEPNEHGDIDTIIKIQDESVLIMRSGVVSMRQVHKKGEWTKGTYRSELGVFSLDTKTDNVLFDWSDKTKKGQLFVTYALLLNETEAGRYTITINFKEERK
ncbi:DUF1934 domain-containing protein [Bacillus sp. 165]|uniref:DUF1934 domain-containing protein n=1 Tax=Bacillus sp. 165 TaxID=1529117 RepID=UPI001ADCA176|nr:DUF1934 domain-containing protein [Bacillus sp. 165]